MFPSSLLNFLSGLAAGAGINMLTSLEGGSAAAHDKIVVDSLIWIAVAGFFAYAAHVVEGAEREAALVSDVSLSRQRRQKVLREEAWRVRWPYRAALAGGFAATVVATVYIPGLGW
jgi:hypothetical protein